jgi:hypothetical protein
MLRVRRHWPSLDPSTPWPLGPVLRGLAERRPTDETASMHRGSWFGIILLLAAVIFQIWVTVRLRRTPIYDGSQKRAQAKLIWLVPVVGAAIVFSVLVSEEAYDRKDKDKDRHGQSS